MRKLTVIGLLFILTGCFLIGCAPLPIPPTGWDYWPADEEYLVTGRVMTFEHRPVGNCKIVIMRQKSKLQGPPKTRPKGIARNELDIQSPANSDLVLTAEYFVAVTNPSGEYSFAIEPWDAYDVWAYFDAEDQGFAPQRVMLNMYWRDQLMRGMGRKVVRVNILLEPKQWD